MQGLHERNRQIYHFLFLELFRFPSSAPVSATNMGPFQTETAEYQVYDALCCFRKLADLGNWPRPTWAWPTWIP